MEYVQVDGQDFRLDELAGCFSEATGQSANRPYHIYLVGKKDGGYKLYRFHVNYINRVVQPLRLERAMDVDRAFAERVKFWWGSFGETYGFYCLDNAIYRFDYYEMEAFDPSEAKKLVTFDNDEEVVDVVPLIPGSGLRDEDYCTVVLLYNSVAPRLRNRVGPQAEELRPHHSGPRLLLHQMPVADGGCATAFQKQPLHPFTFTFYLFTFCLFTFQSSPFGLQKLLFQLVKAALSAGKSGPFSG